MAEKDKKKYLLLLLGLLGIGGAIAYFSTKKSPVPPGQCPANPIENRACGCGGTQRRTCVNGVRGNWGACSIPQGAVRNCGVNGTQSCQANGQWTNCVEGGCPNPPLICGILSGVDFLNVNVEADAGDGCPPYTYFWDFGDGTNSNQETVNHIYRNPGQYLISLRVTDSTGQISNCNVNVNVRSECIPNDTQSQILGCGCDGTGEQIQERTCQNNGEWEVNWHDVGGCVGEVCQNPLRMAIIYCIGSADLQYANQIANNLRNIYRGRIDVNQPDIWSALDISGIRSTLDLGYDVYVMLGGQGVWGDGVWEWTGFAPLVGPDGTWVVNRNCLDGQCVYSVAGFSANGQDTQEALNYFTGQAINFRNNPCDIACSNQLQRLPCVNGDDC